MNMGDALARNAQRFPEKPAIVDERSTRTHRDLHLRSNLEPDAVIRYCKVRLANCKPPKYVEVVASVPRTALGKIDRGKLARERVV